MVQNPNLIKRQKLNVSGGNGVKTNIDNFMVAIPTCGRVAAHKRDEGSINVATSINLSPLGSQTYHGAFVAGESCNSNLILSSIYILLVATKYNAFTLQLFAWSG